MCSASVLSWFYVIIKLIQAFFPPLGSHGPLSYVALPVRSYMRYKAGRGRFDTLTVRQTVWLNE